jgi:hypothetical protein
MASLEHALLGVPQVVFYGIKPWWLYGLLKRVALTPFIAMPNVLAGRRVVPEISWGLSAWRTPQAVREITGEALGLLADEPGRACARKCARWAWAFAPTARRLPKKPRGKSWRAWAHDGA